MQWIWECRYLLKILISFSLDMYPGVGLLDPTVVHFLIFWGTSILSSITATPFYNPTRCGQESSFLHILTRTSCLLSLCWQPSPGLVCFSLVISDTEDFHTALGHLYAFLYFFWEMCIQVLCPLFKIRLLGFFCLFVCLLLSCVSSSYILDTNLLSDT